MRPVHIAIGIASLLAVANLAWTWLQQGDATRRMGHSRSSRQGRDPVPAAPQDGAVRITAFYARSGEITDAEQNVICYGVENASAVRIEPPVASLEPAWNRCFSTEPKRNTRYTLFAIGSDGHSASASFAVRVRPAPPHITYVAVSHAEVHPGEPVTVCYGVERATRVRLDPLGFNLPATAKKCTRFYPPRTLDYTMTAYGALDQTDREKFSIRVK